MINGCSNTKKEKFTLFYTIETLIKNEQLKNFTKLLVVLSFFCVISVTRKLFKIVSYNLSIS